jgi:hypothetical protein
MSIAKSMLGVVVLGACVGVGLAWLERRSGEKELEAILQAPEKLSPVLFPEALPAPVEELPEPGLPAAMERLPVYPGSMPQGLGSTVVADGKPIEMARFFTEDSVEQLRAFYEREFRIRGIHFVSHAFSPYAGYIGYMDWLNEELHLVSYIRQGSQTLVFPSRSKPTQQQEEEPLPAGVPVHPKASLAKTVAFLEPEGGSRISYFASVANESLASVKQFYQEALAAQGWGGIQEKEEGGRSSLEASKEQMVVNFSFEQKQDEVRVYLLLMGRGPGR